MYNFNRIFNTLSIMFLIFKYNKSIIFAKSNLILLLIIWTHSHAIGQYDFSFERSINLNLDNTSHWSVLTNNGKLCKTKMVPSHGENCLCVEKKVLTSESDLYFLSQMIVSNNLKEIKSEILFKIDLKGNFEQNDTISLAIRTFDSEFRPIKEIKEYRSLVDKDKWQEVEITQGVCSKQIMYIFFELTFKGKSKNVVLDNLRLLIDAKPFVNRDNKIDNALVEMVKKYCYPISNFDIRTANISHIFDDKTVVGLGENSHGCHEIQVLRRSIVNDLIETKKFNNIILEDNYFRTHYLNLALHSKDSTQFKSAISGLDYWVNKHQELYKLMNDISFSERLNHVNIYGCDFFLNKAFIKFMTTGNTASVEEIKKFISHFDAMDFRSIFDSDNKGNYWPLEKELFCSIYPNESLTKFQNGMAYKTFDYSLKNFTEYSSTNLGYRSRDKAMFDLGSDIINHKGKSIIIAHNGHIGYYNDRMGNFLKKKYKKKYVTIGFLFYEGSYFASDRGVVEDFPFEAFDETYESIFNKMPYDVFFIDLKEMAKNKALINKLSPRSYYHIGAESHLKNRSINVKSLEHDFDYLIFIKKISPLKPLYDE